MHRPAVIEVLEHRIAPASLLSARSVAYDTADGDRVVITFSKDVFLGTPEARLAKANEVLKFDTGNVAQTLQGAQELRLIDFTKFPVVASTGSTVNGVGLSVLATPFGDSDGLVDVGAIKAVGVSLGSVVIDGDLGQIDAGGSGLKIGVASLTVASFGERGITTQIPVPTPTADNPAPDLVSTITGQITTLKVLGDVQHAQIRVVDGRNAQQQITTIAHMGTVNIAGSLIGRAAMESASDNTGTISSERNITNLIIGSDLTEGIVGGGGLNSGRVIASGSITNVTVSGSVSGGTGVGSGAIQSNGSMNAVRIGADLAGGAGNFSGSLRTYGNIAALTIGDDVVAGAGEESAFVNVLGRINSLVIRGDVDASAGTAGPGSAGIYASSLPAVSIFGSLRGGVGAHSAFVESAREIGVVTVNGSVTGGAGDGSATIAAHGPLRSVLVKGSLLGGGGIQSGAILSGLDMDQRGDLATATIVGSVEGGAGDNSGAIISHGAINLVSIGTIATIANDMLKGGAGDFSGSVSSSGRLNVIRVNGNVQGGAGDFSGSVSTHDRTDEDGEFAGDLGTATIRGALRGGAGISSGSVHTDGKVGVITVDAIAGGAGSKSATITTGLGTLAAGYAGRIAIAKTWMQGDTAAPDSAVIEVGGKLQAFSVGGDVTGGDLRVGENAVALTFQKNVTDLKVTAYGQAVQGLRTDVAIQSLVVRGNVTSSQFLAGYNLAGSAANPDAQVGTVSVYGNWTASDLVAGVAAGPDAGFGNPLDVRATGTDNANIVSKIASIYIAKAVTPAAESHGFVAQLVSRVRIGAVFLPLNAVADEQALETAPSSNVWVREVAVAPAAP